MRVGGRWGDGFEVFFVSLVGRFGGCVFCLVSCSYVFGFCCCLFVFGEGAWSWSCELEGGRRGWGGGGGEKRAEGM